MGPFLVVGEEGDSKRKIPIRFISLSLPFSFDDSLIYMKTWTSVSYTLQTLILMVESFPQFSCKSPLLYNFPNSSNYFLDFCIAT